MAEFYACELCGSNQRTVEMQELSVLCDECYDCSTDWRERIHNNEFYKYRRDIREFIEYRNSL